MSALWKHTDEDGDQVQLMEMNVPNLWSLVISGADHAVVYLDEDALYRLRDEIERISTS